MKRTVTFKHDVPLEVTLRFEEIYPPSLQLDLEEKEELRTLNSIWAWLYLDGQMAGEVYGVPLRELEEAMPGLEDLDDDEIGSIYCYSNTILQPFQGHGWGRILKAHWLGMAQACGFHTVYGHARPNGSQHLAEEFGGVFLRSFPNWYNTGETYKLYKIGLE